MLRHVILQSRQDSLDGVSSKRQVPLVPGEHLKKTAGKQGREERVLELILPLSEAPRNACAPVRAAAEISFTLSMHIPHKYTL